jgi:cell pole-organizing protein PopZ
MLKDWLDNNLQPIVSRTVEREISKLAGRANED